MNALRASNTCSLRCLAGVLAVLIAASCPASAQKKTSAPAPKAAAPVKSAPAAAPRSGGGAGASASHGPTTAGHGPTTATTASHGPTTSSPHVTTGNAGASAGRGGATTANHGLTTAGAGAHTTTTAGAHTTTAAGAGAHGATIGAAGGHTAGAGGAAGHGTAMPAGHVGAGGASAHGASAHATTMGNHTVPANSHIAHAANGSEVRTRANGRVADVHDARRGMDIHHGLNGSRRVEVERADHSRVVAYRGGHGYVEHPYRYGGREYGRRTYYDHGRYYNHYYGHYYYHGAYVDYYTPGFYYRPAFYGWAYNPWVAPISFGWGWGAAPWYGYYGGWFTPYPVYASASLWLTDYMISTTLAAAYQAQVDANAAAQAQAIADAGALTAETKDLIAAEVQRQIALENAEAQVAQTAAPDPASSSIQRMLTDGVQHVFVAGQSLDVVDASGAECAVSEGDALQLSGPPPADATAADLVVLSSKGGQECAKGATVSVSLTDLQEMQNHMREVIDQGMGELQTRQGKGGLPALPAAAAGPTVNASFTSAAPPPDTNAAAEINQQAQAADQAEQETVGSASQSPAASPAESTPQPIEAPAAPPAQISAGQSIDEVTGILGPPKNIVDLGAKKIYVYKDMKITFKGGKVTDVQ